MTNEAERTSSVKDSFSIESLVTLADHYGVAEKIATYVSRPLKEKLEIQCIKSRRLVRTDLQPIIDLNIEA